MSGEAVGRRLTPLPARPLTAPPATAPAVSPDLQPVAVPRTAGDRFVNGAWAGGLAGIKSSLLAAGPIVLLETDIAKWHVGSIGPGTRAGTIALLTLGAIGTGAIAGGLAATATESRTWGTVAGAATGGALIGTVNGLRSRSWQGAATGAVLGALLGGYAGHSATRVAPRPFLTPAPTYVP